MLLSCLLNVCCLFIYSYEDEDGKKLHLPDLYHGTFDSWKFECEYFIWKLDVLAADFGMSAQELQISKIEKLNQQFTVLRLSKLKCESNNFQAYNGRITLIPNSNVHYQNQLQNEIEIDINAKNISYDSWIEVPEWIQFSYYFKHKIELKDWFY